MLTDEIAELDDSEKTLLKASIDELIADTPSTPPAVVRCKKYAAKGGRELAQGLKDILVDMVSETVRKAIWGRDPLRPSLPVGGRFNLRSEHRQFVDCFS